MQEKIEVTEYICFSAITKFNKTNKLANCPLENFLTLKQKISAISGSQSIQSIYTYVNKCEEMFTKENIYKVLKTQSNGT